MAAAMDLGTGDNEDLLLNAEFRNLPTAALRMTSRTKLARFLDLDGTFVVLENGHDILNNYNGLAELAGFDYQSLLNLERKDRPTIAFLKQWNGPEATVGQLWAFLYEMERSDVLLDCRNNIVRDCECYIEAKMSEDEAARMELVQDRKITSSDMIVNETKISTKDDGFGGPKSQTMYDAFICYTMEDEADRKFVREVIDELEKKRGLKLFVPGRDDLPGAAEHVINAYLIEKRCRRVITIISKSFMKSQCCDFQVKFTTALSPGARSKRLIPIIREKGTVMPRILRFLAVCDFTKPDMMDWVWDRLHAAIIATVGPATYFEEEDPSNPFSDLKNIGFPVGPRLDENDEQVRGQLSQSVSVNPSRSLQATPQPLYQRLNIPSDHRTAQENSYHSHPSNVSSSNNSSRTNKNRVPQPTRSSNRHPEPVEHSNVSNSSRNNSRIPRSTNSTSQHPEPVEHSCPEHFV